MDKIKSYILLLICLAFSSFTTAMEQRKKARGNDDGAAAAAAAAAAPATQEITEQFDYLRICNDRCLGAETTLDLPKLKEIEEQAYVNMNSYQMREESLRRDKSNEQQDIQHAHNLMLGWNTLYYRVQLSTIRQHIHEDQQTLSDIKRTTNPSFDEFKKYCGKKSRHIRTRLIPNAQDAQQITQLEQCAQTYDQLASVSTHQHDAGAAGAGRSK